MNSIIEKITRPALILRECDGVPATRILRDRFVPAPILGKARRHTEDVVLRVERGNRLRYGENEALRPWTEYVIEHPVFMEAAHAGQRVQVGTEEYDQLFEEPMVVVKTYAEKDF